MIKSKFQRTDLCIADVDYTDMTPEDQNWNNKMFNWFFYDECDFKLLYDMVDKNCYLGHKVLCSFDKENIDIPTGVIIYIELDHLIVISVLEVNPRYRNRHVGKVMINELKSRNKKICLQSLDSAASFYKKLGFVCELDVENCKDMSWNPLIEEHYEKRFEKAS